MSKLTSVSFSFVCFTALVGSAVAAEAPPQILLRSSWQTVNIGDIGHTPGVLRLLEEHIPQAKVTLWAGKLDRGVGEMLRSNFPRVQIIQGDTEIDGTPKSAELRQAFEQCDFFLHGSGPSLVAHKHLAAWRRQTGKPYGVYCVTLSNIDDRTKELLDGASFVYLRDTVSLELVRKHQIKCPIVEFAPDGAFGARLRNDDAALAFLNKHGLEEGKYLCVIPRLRFTPYWRIHNRAMTETDRERDRVSQQLKESDHAKIRQAMVAFVRQTGMKVLVCPEDMSHMQVGKEMLVDPLPADVKEHVVWRENYWLTDEALSVYSRALALLSMDMHSPIMALANGTPAIHCRFEQQTSKGQMWRDVGLGAWLFDLDEEADGDRITAALLAIVDDPAAAEARAAKAMHFVEQRQRETMAVLRKQLSD